MAKVKGVEKGRPKVDAGMCAPSHDTWLLTLASVCFVCFIDGCFLYLFILFLFFYKHLLVFFLSNLTKCVAKHVWTCIALDICVSKVCVSDCV